MNGAIDDSLYAICFLGLSQDGVPRVAAGTRKMNPTGIQATICHNTANALFVWIESN